MQDKKSNFLHSQAAHCENGAVVNLLTNQGYKISEPMVFGIGAGLMFVYLPFIKMSGAPAMSYRPMPGRIFNRFAKEMGIKIKRMKFSNPTKAQWQLDKNLDQGIATGLVVGVYHLPYFPDEYRFHFNAHNMVAFGKENGQYLISDPVLDHPVTLTEKEMHKVRFAKGTLPPNGHMYYPTSFTDNPDIKSAIKSGILKTCSNMVSKVPIIGVKAIRWVAKDILRWHKKYGPVRTNHNLVNMVRMQEEIGTGGGGFRYLYAAFLQEASEVLGNERLNEFSVEMIKIGDLWRDFALEASRVYKKRSNTNNVYQVLSDRLIELANLEESFFKRLKKAV